MVIWAATAFVLISALAREGQCSSSKRLESASLAMTLIGLVRSEYCLQQSKSHEYRQRIHYEASTSSFVFRSWVEISLWNGHTKFQVIFLQGYSIVPKLIIDFTKLIRTTHGHQQVIDSVRYMTALILGALQGKSKDELLAADYYEKNWTEVASEHPLCAEVNEIVQGSFKIDCEGAGLIGSGYVIDTLSTPNNTSQNIHFLIWKYCLDCALWAFFNSTDFRHGCLLVANLGNDADSTAAVYGQIAGAYYGCKHYYNRSKLGRCINNNQCAAFLLRGTTTCLCGHCSMHLSPKLKRYLWTARIKWVEISLEFLVNLGANVDQTTKPSSDYVYVQQCYQWLERNYAHVTAKLMPGPKAYKCMKDFEHDVAEFETSYKVSIERKLIN